MLRQASRVVRYLPADFVESSSTGGVFTILAWITVVFVCILEIRSFLVTETSTYLSLDRKDADNLQVNFDIEYYDVECRNLRTQAFTPFGDENVHMQVDVTSRALDSKGRTYGMAYRPQEEESEMEHHTKVVSKLQAEDGQKELDADWSSSHDGFKHKSFEHVVEGHDFTFINFFAGWCSHCRHFHPKWTALAAKIHGDATGSPQTFPDRDGHPMKVRLIQMNCVDFKDLCNEKGIDAYPTLRLYKGDNTFSLYEGRRDEADLLRWIERTVKLKAYGWAKHHEAFERGCSMKGSMVIPRAPTTIEVTAGGGDQNLNIQMTNVSMRFKHLSFTEADGVSGGTQARRLWKGLPTEVQSFLNPMDETDYITLNPHEAWTHDLKVVSTITSRGATVYQFSGVHRKTKVAPTEIPQIRIYIDVELFSVWIKTENKRWYEFCTSLLAITGGVFACMRLLSNASLGTLALLLKAAGGSARRRTGLDTGLMD